MPTKGNTSSAKAAKKQPTGKAQSSYTAEELRQANANGEVKDREIVKLSFPNNETLVGYGAMVRGQLYSRQREITAGGDERKKAALVECKEELVEFLATVEDPTE